MSEEKGEQFHQDIKDGETIPRMVEYQHDG